MAKTFETPGVYIGRLEAMTEAELIKERLTHCHALAGIATKKYWWLDWALLTGIVGLTTSVIYLQLASISGEPVVEI